MRDKIITLLHKIRTADMVFGYLLCAIYIIGRSIWQQHDFSLIIHKPTENLLMFIAGGPVTAIILRLCNELINMCKAFHKKEALYDKLCGNRCIWFIMWGLLTAIYMLCYFSYYPGAFQYDAPSQTRQALGLEPLSNFQPAAHTLVWRFFLWLGSLIGNGSEGLVLYSVTQIICVTALITYVTQWITVRSRSVIAASLVCLYFAVSVPLHIFAFLMVKDVPFACFLVLYILACADFIRERSTKNMLLCVLWGVMASIMRNNMIYAIAFAMLTSCLLRPQYIRRLLVSGLSILAIYFIIVNGIYSAAGIAPTQSREALSVPICQLAGVYVNSGEDLSEAEKETIRTYITEPEKFNPRFADDVKSSFNGVWYDAEPEEFWKVYFKVFKKKPVEYLCIFLDLNVDYWYVGAEFPDIYSKRDYIETGIYEIQEYPVERENISDIISGFNYTYENFAHFESRYMRIPLLYNYFSLSFTFISLMFTLYLIITNARRDAAVIHVLLTGLFLTYLLGPVSNFRYMYPYYIALPLYIYLAAADSWKKSR